MAARLIHANAQAQKCNEANSHFAIICERDDNGK